MIRNNFEVLVNQYLSITIDNMTDNIQMYYMYLEDITYNISRCYSVNNTFKQVSKFKKDTSGKKITFLFISIALREIAKNEKINIDIILKREDQNLEENNAVCINKLKLNL